MCWLTLALAGPGAYCLDAAIRPPLRQGIGPVERLVLGPMEQSKSGYAVGAVEPTTARQRTGPLVSRAEVLVGSIGTVILLVLGLLPRGALSTATASTPSTSSSSSASGRSSSSGSSSSSSSSSSAAAGQKVGNTSQMPVNSAISTIDPKSGDPALVIHAADAKFYAYDAVCTHAGCTCEYDPQYKLIVCPCHGGAYDPTHGAQVVAGPPPTPLAELPITIDAQGNIFLS
jgi:thiosulfate dehydrogenase [quinone] large subunit